MNQNHNNSQAFKINKGTLCSALGLKKQNVVDDFDNIYKKHFIPHIRIGYLSHIVSSVRAWYIQNITKNNPVFDINLIPVGSVKIDENDSNFTNGFRINFFSHGDIISDIIEEYERLTHIAIFYPEKSEDMNIKSIRLGIAHELGHAILVGLAIEKEIDKKTIDKIKTERKNNFKKSDSSIPVSATEEKLSSLLGVILLAEKCDFHINHYETYMYDSFEDIVDGMTKIIPKII